MHSVEKIVHALLKKSYMLGSFRAEMNALMTEVVKILTLLLPLG